MNRIELKNLPYYNQAIFSGNVLDMLFCKINPYGVSIDRYSGGGYHPLRGMTLLLKNYENQEETINKIHQINMEYAIEKDGALLFPFKFDFAIHSSKDNIIKADWFSGMVQGLGLVAYSRIMKDIEISNKILKSFEHPEILSIEDGYHYMEYPNYCSPLNGHIFALYGLYECWLWQNNERALFLLEKGMEWVKNNLKYYRNSNGASRYCKEHNILCDKIGGKYHAVHILQLNYLYEMSGDIWFKKQADLLYKDFQPDPKYKLTIGNFPYEH